MIDDTIWIGPASTWAHDLDEENLLIAKPDDADKMSAHITVVTRYHFLKAGSISITYDVDASQVRYLCTKCKSSPILCAPEITCFSLYSSCAGITS